MADWGFPVLTDWYTDFLNYLKSRDEDCAKWFDGTTSSNIPIGAKRWNDGAAYFEKWGGSSWGALKGTYNINVQSLNGQLGSFYQNAGNLNAGIIPAARFNDTAHGNRAGGALHANATITVAGFMSATDKNKVDNSIGSTFITPVVIDSLVISGTIDTSKQTAVVNPATYPGAKVAIIRGEILSAAAGSDVMSAAAVGATLNRVVVANDGWGVSEFHVPLNASGQFDWKISQAFTQQVNLYLVGYFYW